MQQPAAPPAPPPGPAALEVGVVAPDFRDSRRHALRHAQAPGATSATTREDGRPRVLLQRRERVAETVQMNAYRDSTPGVQKRRNDRPHRHQRRCRHRTRVVGADRSIRFSLGANTGSAVGKATGAFHPSTEGRQPQFVRGRTGRQNRLFGRRRSGRLIRRRIHGYLGP